MDKFKILFEYSPWFIACCLLTGMIYAFLLYQKKGSWGKYIQYLLSSLRFLLVTILCILLIGPLFKQIHNTFEKPSVVVAIDNSESVREVMDSMKLKNIENQLLTLENAIREKGFELRYRTMESSADKETLNNIIYEHPYTDLDRMLDGIRIAYEDRNLAGVVLLSDGLYNRGVSPLYKTYGFPIYTIGTGDTVNHPDIHLKALYFNKIAYQGNQFPIIAEMTGTGFINQDLEVLLKKDGKILDRQKFKFKNEYDVQQITFLPDAEETGVQQYEVIVNPMPGELSTGNNSRYAFVDIVEGQEHIVLIASSPHPDIKAIKNAIEINKNYLFQFYIPGQSDPKDLQKILKDSKPDLVIFHQFPANRADHIRLYRDFIAEEIPTWHITGTEVSFPVFNARDDAFLKIESYGNQTDHVTVHKNHLFSGFTVNELSIERMSEYPPVTVPFGEVTQSSDAEVLLYQKVGSVETQKPLLSVHQQSRSAVLLGEGMWKWRLQEYARHESTEVFDQLITKLVQWLSRKEDKRKFHVYPLNEEVYDTEGIEFITEIYNDIYEETYGDRISLTVRDEKGGEQEFSYVTGQNNTRYKISSLPRGVYTFKATVTTGGKTMISEGAFSVKSWQLESLQLRANHDLLKEISEKSGGRYFHMDEIDELTMNLISQDAKQIIHSEEELRSALFMKEIFIVLLILISAEWFIRKFKGAY